MATLGTALGCAHFYCQECIVRFIVSKLQDNVTSVTCPDQGCPGVLDLEYCRPILPYDVFHRWGKALCESVKLRDMGEDQQLEELAKNKNWRRCPSCKYYVERRDGCSYIKCRCGYAFCYNCGVRASLTSHTRHCPSCHK
ncbi:PREDICTED: probable E3 ubiquitin-protein ligase ARI9 [Prunus mume]|uniref:RBR-type E3 ubiquitin transferase n=1 Tax=Prunus mume TaxID=102107 RepID=A0ABM1LVZ0_PRUMU|nr:PREDICTED: probable E3 ubiquitin-protein ligase ARI9 [Prunus mume]